MDLQAQASSPSPSDPLPSGSSRLEPMLVRLPPSLAGQLRKLAQVTRIRQSDYLREAVADLLQKYRHVEVEQGETR
jgi:Arc/MetJ-type ribon-helix-helix transcriptional regulator